MISYGICLSLSDITLYGDLWSIQVAANGIILFLLWLSSFPLYMHHIFFIHSSVNGHSGCFHVLAIVNSAAMNRGDAVILWNCSFVWLYLWECTVSLSSNQSLAYATMEQQASYC